MSIITIDQLSVNYGGVRALTNVSLSVEAGEFIGIIGPNGGGKSTLMKTILGILEGASGSVTLDPSVVVGYVPQHTNFDRGFPINVMEVILTGHLPKKLTLFHRFKGHDENHALKVMKRLKIDHLAKRQIGELSGGQLQRVLIARALMNHPTVLFLDEPTASVDESSKKEIYEMLSELNQTMTILMVTHDTSTIWPYLDRCIYINQTAHIHDHVKEKGEVLDNCPIEWYLTGEQIKKDMMQNVKEVQG